MQVSRKSRWLLPASLVIAAFAAPAANAAVTETDYPQAERDRTFSSPDHGWTEEEHYAGACLRGTTCPEVENLYVDDGGADGAGDGFLRTEMGSLAGVAATTGGVLESPVFEYNGVDGQEPTKLLRFTLSQRVDLEAFLDVGGNRASYSVQLVDLDARERPLRLVQDVELQPTEGWVEIEPIGIDPGQLTMGHRYQLIIVTRFTSGVEIEPGGTVDYDNVVLHATFDSKRAERPGEGDAVLKGNRLFLRLFCLRATHRGKCTIKATAYSSRGGKRMTFPITRKVDAKRGKVITMRVRPRFVKKLAEKDAVLMRIRHFKKGKRSDVRKTVWRKYNLIHKEKKG